jgi:serine/threonine protein kinase
MNILVKRIKAHDIEYVVAKVADFGLSKTKERTRTYSNQTLNLGTTRWMAPELINSCAGESKAEMSEGKEKELKYPFKSDIYSFGMVCYEILTGDIPFSNLNPSDIKKQVLDLGRPPLPHQCPLLLKRLIKRCWSADPSKRPSFGEICAELRHLKCLLLMPCKSRFIGMTHFSYWRGYVDWRLELLYFL